MGKVRALGLWWIGATAMSSVLMLGCRSAGCPAPLQVSGLYEERVNCDEDNMCVIEDETDMVAVEADADDPAQITFVSLLTGLNGQGILCGSRVDWTGSTNVRDEQGTWVFGAAANTYTRTSTYTVTNPGESGACTGTASKVGPPGPPKAVGVCPSGAGGSGGDGGTGGCVPFSTKVGGSQLNPVIWEEVYTCIDDSGDCLGLENTEVALALIQDNQRIDWSIVDGVGMGSEYSGDLCGTSFEWTSEPSTEQEEGCWEFTADRFNKRSFGAGFYCVGSGSRGAGSTPVPTPTCKDIAAANIDFSACPDPPL
jgi:hypothetical protein